MTPAQFDTEQKKLLEGIPAPFAVMINEQAYDRGHHAGREEVFSILSGLASDIKRALHEHCKEEQMQVKYVYVKKVKHSQHRRIYYVRVVNSDGKERVLRCSQHQQFAHQIAARWATFFGCDEGGG